MPYKDPEKRNACSKAWKEARANSEKKRAAPETTTAAGKAHSIEIPALPLPKPNTKALPKVYYEEALIYITQQAKPESARDARAWMLDFLRGQGWSLEKITAFFDSREDRLMPVYHSASPDVRVAWKLFQAGLYNPLTPYIPGVPDWGGFLLDELSNWYLFFTKWYCSIEISDTDRRRRPEQAENLREKRDSRDSLA
jgi:hypothetical protein